MEIFDKIEIKLKSPKEHYKSITSLYQKRADVVANMNRSAYHQEYYGLRFQQISLAKLIDAQEKMLKENRGKGADDVIEEYLANNQIVLQALEQKISPMRKSISEALIAICHLLERYCKSCNVCSKKIPCGSGCLECYVNDCPHIVCVTCNGLNLRPSISTSSQNNFANRELITSKRMTEGSPGLPRETAEDTGQQMDENQESSGHHSHQYRQIRECTIPSTVTHNSHLCSIYCYKKIYI